MRRIANALACLAASISLLQSMAFAQTGKPPEFPVPELTDFIPQLAKSVELIGQNRVEDSFNALRTELNPAFRNQASLEKFRESWTKLFQPLGRLRVEFESFDVTAYHRVSTQAYFLYGIANGANGPVLFDFRVFRYRGRWHVHGFSYRASGWEREPKINEHAIRLPMPVSYPLGSRPVAARNLNYGNNTDLLAEVQETAR